MENAGTVGFVFSPPQMTWRGKWEMACSLSCPPSSGPSHQNTARSPWHQVADKGEFVGMSQRTHGPRCRRYHSFLRAASWMQNSKSMRPHTIFTRLQWVPSPTPDSTARGAWHVDIHMHVCVHVGIYNMNVCMYMKYACKCIHTYIKHGHKHKQARRIYTCICINT